MGYVNHMLIYAAAEAQGALLNLLFIFLVTFYFLFPALFSLKPFRRILQHLHLFVNQDLF